MMQSSVAESNEFLGTEEFDYLGSDDETNEGGLHARILAQHIAKYMTPKNKLMS